MKPTLRIILLFSFILGFAFSSSAQTSWHVKETVVLINGVPSKVVLHHSGEILKVIEEIKSFSFASKENPDKILNGYKLNTNDNQPIGAIQNDDQNNIRHSIIEVSKMRESYFSNPLY